MWSRARYFTFLVFLICKIRTRAFYFKMKLQMNHNNTDKNRTALVDAGVGVGQARVWMLQTGFFICISKLHITTRKPERKSREVNTLGRSHSCSAFLLKAWAPTAAPFYIPGRSQANASFKMAHLQQAIRHKS